MFEFKMPQLGETVLEATITRWLKKLGDTVQEDDPLVEVSTDKVDSEIPSPFSGVISRILFQEGETVPVGAVMVEIDAEGGAKPQAAVESAAPAPAPKTDPAPAPAPAPAPETDPAPAPAPAPETDPAPETYPAPAPAASESAPEEVADVSESAEPQAPTSPASDGRASNLQAVLSPLVRRLAAENGVDLSDVAGTGSGGRITKQDVLEAAKRSAVAQAPPAPAAPPVAPKSSSALPPSPAPAAAQSSPHRVAGGAEEVIQVSPMRKTIAEHMVASNSQTARAWNTIEVDLSKVGHLRGLAGPGFKEHEGFSLTWMPFVSMAVTQALLKFPQLNSTWNGDGTITRKHYVNLGIAVALENGLIVPVIKQAEGMNLVGLARAVRDIADRARNKKLTPDDVQGGTFTITNPGGFGSIMSVPIINKGQTAILSFDAVVKRPVVLTDGLGGESIGIRQMTFLSMSWDHRIIDGAEAARFLAYLKSLLEEADFTADLSGLLPT